MKSNPVHLTLPLPDDLIYMSSFSEGQNIYEKLKEQSKGSNMIVTVPRSVQILGNEFIKGLYLPLLKETGSVEESMNRLNIVNLKRVWYPSGYNSLEDYLVKLKEFYMY